MRQLIMTVLNMFSGQRPNVWNRRTHFYVPSRQHLPTPTYARANIFPAGSVMNTNQAAKCGLEIGRCCISSISYAGTWAFVIFILYSNKASLWWELFVSECVCVCLNTQSEFVGLFCIIDQECTFKCFLAHGCIFEIDELQLLYKLCRSDRRWIVVCGVIIFFEAKLLRVYWPWIGVLDFETILVNT